ncbi:C40 family peptidase [Streptomyces sp. NBC_01353]|uniref:C40 family peptidase n=1 Tax=Streptomyces sp. NBC_01353 TaxID=2903835 RepID=UPI003DA4BAFB
MGAVAVHVTGLGSEAEAAAAQHQCTTGNADTTQISQQVQAVLAGSTGDVKVSGLSAPKEQVANAKVIVATGIQMQISARGQVIALATALQESTLRNISYGDRDSLGLFQQRPSQGWGTREQILEPVYASQRFYSALKSVNGWEQMPLTVAAQKVQKSGFPDAYAQHESLATALQQAIAPTLGAAGGLAQAGTLHRAGCTGTGPATVDYGTIPPGTLPAGYQIPLDAPPAVRTAIRWALGQLGTPYQWGGTCTNPHGPLARNRCDCSSLIQRAYGVAGIELTRTTYRQIHDGYTVPSTAVRPGDLVFTVGTATRPEHVAMAIGNGLVVHAPLPGRVVEVAELATHGTILLVRRMVQ